MHHDSDAEDVQPAFTWVTVDVAVAKEASNEAEHWSPPSAREVAAFVERRVSRAETDDGWYAGTVRAPDAPDAPDAPVVPVVPAPGESRYAAHPTHPLRDVPQHVLDAARTVMHDEVVCCGDIAAELAEPVADLMVMALLPWLSFDATAPAPPVPLGSDTEREHAASHALASWLERNPDAPMQAMFDHLFPPARLAFTSSDLSAVLVRALHAGDLELSLDRRLRRPDAPR